MTKGDFSYSRCAACGLYSLENIPLDLNSYYSEGYFSGDVELDGYVDYEAEKLQTVGVFKKYLKILKNYKGVGHTLFEIGCATGFFLDLARADGWSVSGIDVSKYATDRAIEKGLAVDSCSLEGYAKNNCDVFDAIVLLDTVEHLSTPVNDFKIIATKLKSGGMLAFSTPDAGSLWAKIWRKKWHAFVPPQHINLFSRKNIEFLLKSNDLEQVYIGHFGKFFSLPYIFRLLKTWTSINFFGTLATFCNSNFLRHISIPINVGDTMFIVARKI
ncbi:MAG: class I SAM-dependent methyltransferase [bacterium]